MMNRARALRAVWLITLFPLLPLTVAAMADDAADAAIERAEAWVQREPESVSARCELAEAYLHRYKADADDGSLHFAAATAEQAIELDGESARAQSTLARVYQAQGRSEAAVRHAQQALEIQPGHPEARRVARERGRHAATPRAQPAAPATPSPPTAQAPSAAPRTPAPPPAAPTAAPPASSPPPAPSPPRPKPRLATPSPPPPIVPTAPQGGGGRAFSGAVPLSVENVPLWVPFFGVILAAGIIVMAALLMRLLHLRSLGATFTIRGRAPVVLTRFTTTIGRGAGSGIRIIDPEISGRHAEIQFSGGAFRLRDLGSQNGVRVNGNRIVAHTLRSGDEIVLGSTALQFGFDPRR